MSVEMVPVEIIGLKTDLRKALYTLRELGFVQIDDLSKSPEVSARVLTLDRETLNRQEELSFLLAKAEGMIAALGGAEPEVSTQAEGVTVEQIQQGFKELTPQVQSLLARREELQTRLALLPRYEVTLHKLLPLLPASAHESGNISIGVLVSRAHVGVTDLVATRAQELTGGRAEVVASDVDSTMRAMFIVTPKDFAPQIETLLGQQDVSRLRLPAELSEGPPDMAFQALRRQLSALPAEIRKIDRELAGLGAEWRGHLLDWRAYLREELDAAGVLSRFGETDMTFVAAGWTPEKDCARLEEALHAAIGEAVLVRRLPLTAEMKKLAPVDFHNPKTAQPFQSLVRLVALPGYGHIDPTRMMAFFMPIFFGMILGDVGYGALLLALSLLLLRRMRRGIARDILIVLAMGSVWGIAFGVLYGEAFGTLGERWGMRPLWFDRASPEHVAGLLVMSLVVGAVHITLGLILGVWESVRSRSHSELLERGGKLLGLICLFFIVGILAKALPQDLMTPAIAGMVVGVALIGASLGWLGLLMGPIEFIGLIGNVLSYLRIAAIGLASVYLAKVANDLAGMVGNIVVGVILAVLIHTLNLALGAFSPTIHSLRLHYVEFFRTFYEGGGRAYRPYRRLSSGSEQ